MRERVGAAGRRRERRLRAWLRHEWLTVAMELADGPPPQRTAPEDGCGGAEGAEGSRDEPRRTGTEGASTGDAARHPRGAWAAEE